MNTATKVGSNWHSGFSEGKCKSLRERMDTFAGLNIVEEVHVFYTRIIGGNCIKTLWQKEKLSSKHEIQYCRKTKSFFPPPNIHILHFSLT